MSDIVKELISMRMEFELDMISIEKTLKLCKNIPEIKEYVLKELEK
jgi:hypothetical protein